MDAYSLLHKKPWSDGLRNIFDQADINLFENKYRWCLDGDGGDAGDGGEDDSGEVGGYNSPDTVDSYDSEASGEVGGFNSEASFDAVSGASPGYGGPGVEGALGSPGIDASPGYGAPGVEGPASLGFGFGPAMAEEPGFFGSIHEAVFGPAEFDPSKNFAYAEEYGVPAEPSLLDMAINTVVGTPVSSLIGGLVGGPVGIGLGVLGSRAVEEAFGPSIATDPMSYSLGLTDTPQGIGSLASGMGLGTGLGMGPGTSSGIGSLGFESPYDEYGSYNTFDRELFQVGQ